MGRVTPAFCYLILFLWPKFSFDIFTDFKMVGTSNSIANHKVKWRVLTFQACNTFYYKFSFLFQVSKNWKETSQNTSQTSRITQTKSRSQTCHKSEKRPKKLTNFIVLERFLVVLQTLSLAILVCKPAPFWEAGSCFSLYQHFVFCSVCRFKSQSYLSPSSGISIV